ncbi:MAG: zeta toxin family protein [Bacteroidales bacterium]|jgi:ABC-type cobalamin/Fe3+-siderophores transport system ATPase subunit|nr:zeta toxin family protein [Bacteroidales bacterium]
MSELLYEQCVAAGTLGELENLNVYKNKKIFEDLAHNAIPQDNPIAIILGGQNASGKSTLGKQFLKEYQNAGGIVKIEGDALREYHPLFPNFIQDDDKLMTAYTAKDSGRWTERVIRDCAASKRNMLIETTLRNPDVATGTVKQLHQLAGYDVQVKAFVVSYDKSLVGCFRRYERMKLQDGFGRFVHDHALNAAYAGMPKTLQALKEQNLASCIHLYTQKQPLFIGDYWKTDIVNIVNQERRREFTTDEVKDLHNQWNDVFTMMRSRGAGKEEFSEISERLSARIQSMITEKYPQTNINTIINIHHELNQKL